MSWLLPSLRARRAQVRDAIAQHLPGADATQPNSVLRVLGDTQALLTHDNDQHLAWLARMQMPDTAEGPWLERWANIWLPQGRKGATAARGQITITGAAGSAVPTDSLMTAAVVSPSGQRQTIEYRITSGGTFVGTSLVLPVEAITLGALGNLDEGARIAFSTPPDGIDGQATVSAPGLAGGADIESDRDLRDRMLARIQAPPHGGAAHDYVAWALEVPGVTRAWAAQEVGIGTVTLRVMLDEVRRTNNGLPEPEDLALVYDYIEPLRPVTVAEWWCVQPIAQPLSFTVSALVGDRPEVRGAIRDEVASMLRVRARPGGMIYASWVREAISAATGEERHDVSLGNVTPLSAGHLIVPGVISFA